MAEQDCRHLLAALGDYIDGTLEEQICRELEKHMAECPNCRVVVDTMRKMIYLYRVEASEEQAPAEARQRLFARLNLDG
ncbi:MAG: zf-HC2 domain-containing protein [Anaerolineales bacterium]